LPTSLLDALLPAAACAAGSGLIGVLGPAVAALAKGSDDAKGSDEPKALLDPEVVDAKGSELSKPKILLLLVPW